MKTIDRRLVLLAAPLLSLSLLAGCGGGSETSSPAAEAETDAAADETEGADPGDATLDAAVRDCIGAVYGTGQEIRDQLYSADIVTERGIGEVWSWSDTPSPVTVLVMSSSEGLQAQLAAERNGVETAGLDRVAIGSVGQVVYVINDIGRDPELTLDDGVSTVEGCLAS